MTAGELLETALHDIHADKTTIHIPKLPSHVQNLSLAKIPVQ